ncbi:hypothetical protein BC937DRAFT_90966 [Endogone sp. FLAS-F59071]|nr:hypothetical protein BC937DRAFT_90966 [Endogone sp. FLAS-F59071]|eukprot:RUS21941.1 hypothetical protein BC937DRAFT_90966 [Endogone sp. FLAS-F59071]
MTDTIKLFYLVHGENPVKHAFSVVIEKDTTVGELKDLILIKRKHDLQNIDSVNITLWKVSIPMDELSKLDLHFEFSTPSPNLKNKYSAILPDHELSTEHATARLANKLICEYHQNIETEGMQFTQISETKL